MVQLEDRADHRPGRLSGGEQQRVAIARAVANAPRVLLADEPTGNLDSTTADAVFRQLLALVRETGMAALVATHNPELAAPHGSHGDAEGWRVDGLGLSLPYGRTHPSGLVSQHTTGFRRLDGAIALLVAGMRAMMIATTGDQLLPLVSARSGCSC